MFPLFIEYIRYTAEVSLACFTVTYGLTRKRGFYLRILLLYLTAAALSFAISLMDRELTGIVYCVLTLFALLWVVLPFEGSVWNKLFSFMTGSMLRMCARKVFDISVAIINQPQLDRMSYQPLIKSA